MLPKITEAGIVFIKPTDLKIYIRQETQMQLKYFPAKNVYITGKTEPVLMESGQKLIHAFALCWCGVWKWFKYRSEV